MRQQDPLRALREDERSVLQHLSRASREPAAVVARAKAVVAVAGGATYTAAAQAAGPPLRGCGRPAGRPLQSEGTGSALSPARRGTCRSLHERRARTHPGRGSAGAPARGGWDRDLVTRDAPARPASGARRLGAGEHLHHLVRADRRGLELAADADVVPDRDRRPAAPAGTRPRPRSGRGSKKGLIEQASQEAEAGGVAVACQDEAGPFQTVPYPGTSWAPVGRPGRQPHESVRLGTVKLLTLRRPATGAVRVKGVTRCPNGVLQAWLKGEGEALLATLPESSPVQDPRANRAQWTPWQAGLHVTITLPADLPPLRLLLVWDNLAGHHTPELLLWLFQRGVMVLSTPLAGSWLNRAESLQRILKRRALDGQHPQTVEELITWLEATARGWNAAPTPFVWGGKRAARRVRARERRRALAGSGACCTHSLHHRSYGNIRRN